MLKPDPFWVAEERARLVKRRNRFNIVSVCMVFCMLLANALSGMFQIISKVYDDGWSWILGLVCTTSNGFFLAALIQLRFMMDAIYGDIVKLDNGTYVAESMLIRQDMMAEAKRSKEETTEEAKRLKVEEKKDEENQ